ncbi:26S proteasome, regulatory subunit Rpn7 [Carpediemonas membranifera]|uniref:26S proteasome, regulatory subunit Rpn7 n=1 Tax=Carpediemonas membranifera TaxID=201153 RepID=A0A8J6AXG3_9EUKA|nr:26S proteasome, regulatory subunit Rpn7 [Carpediemonas membranifera]|eukprot:KAG9393930.1 26S proteasome, regulatory subunit Rpn7 [Carpediemonas membranifera]
MPAEKTPDNVENETTDFEKKNRQKAIEALDCMKRRNFKKAATLLISLLETFNATDAMSFEQMIKYTCLCGVYTLDRAELKEKLIQSPEVIAVTSESEPLVGEFMSSLYECNYARFVELLEYFSLWMRTDERLAPHAAHYLHTCRVKAFKQFLVAYQNVSIDRMASTFGVDPAVLEKALAGYIALGHLESRIDMVAGVIGTKARDDRSKLYTSLLRDGGDLLEQIGTVMKSVIGKSNAG